MSQTLISQHRSTSLDLGTMHILSSPTFFWREVLNLVDTCVRVWHLWRSTLTFQVNLQFYQIINHPNHFTCLFLSLSLILSLSFSLSFISASASFLFKLNRFSYKHFTVNTRLGRKFGNILVNSGCLYRDFKGYWPTLDSEIARSLDTPQILLTGFVYLNLSDRPLTFTLPKHYC